LDVRRQPAKDLCDSYYEPVAGGAPRSKLHINLYGQASAGFGVMAAGMSQSP
jgi:hypothetical protein